MTAAQEWFIAMAGCGAVAIVLTLIVSTKMWTASVNWLVWLVLLFYGGAIVSALGLGFTALGRS